MKEEHLLKLEEIKQQSIEFHEKISFEINHLCNTIDYRKASRLSHIADRLDLFINELKEFN